jgi:hypothetical protein
VELPLRVMAFSAEWKEEFKYNKKKINKKYEYKNESSVMQKKKKKFYVV